MNTRCTFCERELDPHARETWRLMTGWARRGKAGGSDIACREWQGSRFACDVCIRRLQEGVAPAQEALV